MPQGRKYVPSHSGGMESKPWRAKARISSRWSQGFLARFRRSTRWALVSVGADIFSVASLGDLRIHRLETGFENPQALRPELQKLRTKTKSPRGRWSGTWASKLRVQKELDSEAPLAR